MSNQLTQWFENNRYLISDGATGTNLIARGLPRGKTAEEWVLENPQEILTLHRDFINAGSNIILTSTFGASEIRLTRSGLGERHKEINLTAVNLAKRAADGRQILIAGSIGPLGEMLQPYGALNEATARKNYRQQAAELSMGGVDFLLIETQFDIAEAILAIEAAKSVSDLPIICSFSFDRGTKTMMGVSPSRFVESIAPMGVAALGINCGKSLDDNLNVLKELSNVTELPIWFKPNAGLPKVDDCGHAAYDVTPDQMARNVSSWIEYGARIIGGCCGTSPEHLHALKLALESYFDG